MIQKALDAWFNGHKPLGQLIPDDLLHLLASIIGHPVGEVMPVQQHHQHGTTSTTGVVDLLLDLAIRDVFAVALFPYCGSVEQSSAPHLRRPANDCIGSANLHAIPEALRVSREACVAQSRTDHVDYDTGFGNGQQRCERP